jgi:hypothetical protein
MRVPLSMLDLPILSLAISYAFRPKVMRADENTKDFDNVEDKMRLNHICGFDMRRWLCVSVF